MKTGQSNGAKTVLVGILDDCTFSLILYFVCLVFLVNPFLLPSDCGGLSCLFPERGTGFLQRHLLRPGAFKSIRALGGREAILLILKLARREVLPEAPPFACPWSFGRYFWILTIAGHCASCHHSLHSRPVKQALLPSVTQPAARRTPQNWFWDPPAFLRTCIGPTKTQTGRDSQFPTVLFFDAVLYD